MFGNAFSARTVKVNQACDSVLLPISDCNSETLDNYGMDSILQVEAQLGAGGSGAVYKAWHERLRKYLVVKKVKHSSSGGIEARRNEVEALKSVKSAYLPQVYDFLTKDDTSYTVMEFIEGESFDKLLERGERFTQSQVIKWYTQLASALEAIHKQNICHRDIKPSNIMLTPGGDVCVIDFNAALVGGNDTRLISQSMGYASPEQYEYFQRAKEIHSAYEESCGNPEPLPDGENVVSSLTGDDTCNDYVETQLLEADSITKLIECRSPYRSAIDVSHPMFSNSYEISPGSDMASAALCIDWKLSDIYSLGATMYHLLMGNRPPEKENDAVALLNIRRYNAGIARVIEKSMRRKPTERFASATQLAEAIQNINRRDEQQYYPRTKWIALILSVIAIVLLYRLKRIFWQPMNSHTPPHNR